MDDHFESQKLRKSCEEIKALFYAVFLRVSNGIDISCNIEFHRAIQQITYGVFYTDLIANDVEINPH